MPVVKLVVPKLISLKDRPPKDFQSHGEFMGEIVKHAYDYINAE